MMRKSKDLEDIQRTILAILTLGLASMFTACGAGSRAIATGPGSATIKPTTAQIRAGSAQQFTSSISSAPIILNNGQTVPGATWSVNGIAGGNASVGTISTGGLYTAPATLPSPNGVTVSVTSAVYANTSASAATTLLNPVPVVSTVAPGSIYRDTPVLITVTGSHFVSGAQILWSGSAVPTTVVSATELTTSVNISNIGTYPVAVMNPDPGSALSAQLNERVLKFPDPIISSISPTSFPEATPTVITVNGSLFLQGAQIFWNGAAVSTTYVSSTQLLASITQPTSGKFPVTVMNPTAGSSPTGQLFAQVIPGQDVVTINPQRGVRVRVNDSIGFNAAITGTQNMSVTWTLNGTAAGNATIGTIVVKPDGSVTYTAPAVVPSPNIVTLTAVSADNSTATLTRDIVILNPIPTLSSVTPSVETSTGNVAVILAGANFINGATLTLNGNSAPVTYNSSGQLSATLNLPNPGNYVVQVTNPDPGAASTAELTISVNGTPPTPLVTPEDASRFLDQATFGATPADIQNLSNIGYQAWLNQQFAIPQTSHVPYVDQEVQVDSSTGICAATNVKCNQSLFLNNNNFNGVWQSFFLHGIQGNDGLRQRVAYTLTQIFVISNGSGANGAQPRGYAVYLDMLGKDGFGNFRTLLEDVTLSAQMGQFLSALGNEGRNSAIHPDENYAREVMQLFTMGLYQLNPDGTQKLDGSGNPIQAYTLNDVEGLAAVFTGFGWNVPAGPPDNYTPSGQDFYNPGGNVGPGVGADLWPMKAYDNHHSVADKTFLGTDIPAGSSDSTGDLKIALDTIFNHPNVPPFICKQLIQHLVTSNPSSAYVSRVAAVFQDNGSGVRGDMKAVITAILLDTEARDSATAFSTPQAGKVRESLVRYMEWARAFSAQSHTGVDAIGSPEDRAGALGEMALRSPSVFNWFAPNYEPPNTSLSMNVPPLLSPEFQMTDVVTTVGYINYMENAVGANINSYKNYGPDIFSAYTAEIPLAGNPDQPGQLMDHLNLLLMAGNMSTTLRDQILTAVNAISIPASDQNAINAALLTRVQTAVFLIVASPDFCAQE